MKSESILILAIAVLPVGLSNSVWAQKYGGGTGEPNNPYRIETPNDLNDIGNHPEDFNDCFILVNDINMAGFTYTTAVIAPDINNSNYDFDGTAFTGVFDGSGCKITALTVDDGGAGNDYLGLFGCIVGGQVRNLGLDGGSVNGTNFFVGGLVGANVGSVSGCYSTGDVNGTWYFVGGLVGANVGSVSNCYSTGSVSGYAAVGGIVGYNPYTGSVSNCYSTSDVSGSWQQVGGLMGVNVGTVSNCYSTGDVSGESVIGGLVGDSDGNVTNCYSTGDVSGTGYYVGGLEGFNNNASVSNCYSTGEVSGDGVVGGLVAWNFQSSVSNSFWDTQTSGMEDGIGRNDGGTITNLFGRTTAEMQMESTFTDYGWDFVGETANGPNDIWTIHDTVDYPKLVWKLANFIGWYEVDFLDFAFFAERWANENCGSSNDCDGTDLDFSDEVDWGDLKIFCDHWLEGTEP